MNPITINEAYNRYKRAQTVEQVAYDISYLVNGCVRLSKWLSDIDHLDQFRDQFSPTWTSSLNNLVKMSSMILPHVGDVLPDGIITAWANPVNISNQLSDKRQWNDDKHLETELTKYELSLQGALLLLITEIKHLQEMTQDVSARHEALLKSDFLRFGRWDFSLLQFDMLKASYADVFNSLHRWEQLLCSLYENDPEWDDSISTNITNNENQTECTANESLKSSKQQENEQHKNVLNMTDIEDVIHTDINTNPLNIESKHLNTKQHEKTSYDWSKYLALGYDKGFLEAQESKWAKGILDLITGEDSVDSCCANVELLLNHFSHVQSFLFLVMYPSALMSDPDVFSERLSRIMDELGSDWDQILIEKMYHDEPSIFEAIGYLMEKDWQDALKSI